MENSRIQLWQCRLPFVPSPINIKEEPAESLDCIEHIGDDYSVKDVQNLQVQNNDRNMNEIMIPEIQESQCGDYVNSMNEIGISKTQVPQDKYKDNILNKPAISEIQKPHIQCNENLLNESTIPKNQNPLAKGNENTMSETFMSENQIEQGHYNENVLNEIATLAIKIPKGKCNGSIVNKKVIPKNQIPQVQNERESVNEIVILENQVPLGQYSKNIVNEIATPENRIPQVHYNKNFMNKTTIPVNNVLQDQYNKIIVNRISIANDQANLTDIGNDKDAAKCKIKGCICTNPYDEQNSNLHSPRKKHLPKLIPQVQNRRECMNEIVIAEIKVPQNQYNKNIVNDIATPENQIPQGQYNKNIVNGIVIPENHVNLTDIGNNKDVVKCRIKGCICTNPYDEQNSNLHSPRKKHLPRLTPQGQNKRESVNEIVITENQVPLEQYSKNIENEIATPENLIPQVQYNKNFINKATIPVNDMLQDQYNKIILNRILIPKNQANLTDIGNDKDAAKCRIKGCICTNPYDIDKQNSYIHSPQKKHLPRLTRIRRPFMNSPSPRRRHLPRLTRIKLPPLKRIKPLPTELGNTRMINNLPQPNTTPLIISTQEIIHRIIHKCFKNLSINSNVNPISGNQNISREVSKDIGKKIFKESVSMIKRMNPNLQSNILHMKQKIHKEIFGTVFECNKNNSKTNKSQGEYQCIECGYKSKYTHHMKSHVKSHNLEQNKENQQQIPSFNIFENNKINFPDKVEEKESKISPQILPKVSKRIRKKNQWQKCPLCLYISNSTIALARHINHSHKTHLKQKSYALYIKGDEMVENSLSKNHYLENEKIENKITLNNSRSKKLEVCSLCGFNTYSLPDFNSHLRSHIPCELQRNNSLDDFVGDNQTLPSSESNITNERRINISESSDYIKDNRTSSSTIKYSRKRNHKRLKISEFLPILDLNNYNKFPSSVNDEDSNGNTIDTEYDNKQIMEKDMVRPSVIRKSNKYAEEESSLNDFIQFNDENDSQDFLDVEEDRSSDFFETEIISEGREHDQPIKETFINSNDYLPKENPRKSILRDILTDYSQNEVIDLTIEHNNQIVENSHLQSSLNKSWETNCNFESKNNIKEKLHSSGTNYGKVHLSCLECGACFKNRWDYKRHIKISHKKCKECSPEQECAYRISKEFPVVMKTKSFECSECNYASTTKGSFVRHMQTHSIEKSFECNICGYRCTGSGELQRHSWVHKGGGKHLNFWPLTNFL